MAELTDNMHFAIYARVNDLADRWGIKPHQFNAYARMTEDSESVFLRYLSSDAEIGDTFDKMLNSLQLETDASKPSASVQSKTAQFEGSPVQLLLKLDKALDVAPKLRTPNNLR